MTNYDKAVLLEWWKKEWKKDNSRKRGCASTSTDPQPWLAPNISPCSSLSCSRTRRLWAKGKQTLIKCQCYSTTQPVLPEYLVTLLLCYMNTLLPENFDVAANDNLVFLSISKSQTDHLYEEGNVIHLLWRLVGRIFISISCFHKNHLVFWNWSKLKMIIIVIMISLKPPFPRCWWRPHSPCSSQVSPPCLNGRGGTF